METAQHKTVPMAGPVSETDAGYIESRFRHLFDDGFDAVLLTAENGDIQEVNSQAIILFGLQRESLIGKNLYSLSAPGEEWPAVTRTKEDAIPDFTGRVLEEGATGRSERQVHTVEVHARRVQERPAQWQWVLHDVTGEAEMAAMRQDLIAMLVHDLQSPLGNVISSLELLRHQLTTAGGDATMLSLLDIAYRSGNQLQRLIASLLDISRLETGHPISGQVAAPVSRLVAEAYEIEQPTFEKRQVAFTPRIPADLPDVYVDEDIIGRVLLNLLDNALKYSHEGQQITVDAEYLPDDRMVLVSVSDQGIGIPPELRETIFEKFQRIETDPASKGLGLGLAFCRLAVKAHLGRIWVDDAPEGGARFNLTLPAVAPELEPAPQIATAVRQAS